MKFFLSAEAQAGGASLLMTFHRAAEPLLNTLESKDYGEELTDISIITILVRNELLEDGSYPERQLFQRKTHSADLRLRLDYMEFLSSTPEHRSRLYCRHIVNSMESLGARTAPITDLMNWSGMLREYWNQVASRKNCTPFDACHK